jgi:hypothetical protein
MNTEDERRDEAEALQVILCTYIRTDIHSWIQKLLRMTIRCGINQTNTQHVDTKTHNYIFKTLKKFHPK